jgi:hypothetical protein
MFTEGVRPGGSLVTVLADDTRVGTVGRIMVARSPVNWPDHERGYQSKGRERSDPNAPAWESHDTRPV